MKDKTTKSREEQLGMSFGKANNILTRKIIFNLIEKSNENICFRCNKKIKTVNEMTIDHKIDWLHSKTPKKLFFDTKNIKFSHKVCNVCRKQESIVTGKIQYKGVHKTERKKPYRSVICIDKKRKYIGDFNNAKEAAIAYDIKSIEIFGKSAITNKKLGLL